MKLQEAKIFFEDLKNKTTKKSEIKVYDKILNILNYLNNRDFSTKEIESLEDELKSYNFKANSTNSIRFFKKILGKLEKFLRTNLNLTPKDYYLKISMGIGMNFGLLFGIVFLSSLERSIGISYGILIGMVVGLIIGKLLESKAKSEGRVF